VEASVKNLVSGGIQAQVLLVPLAAEGIFKIPLIAESNLNPTPPPPLCNKTFVMESKAKLALQIVVAVCRTRFYQRSLNINFI
jgi:hypothetical protein